MPLLVPPTSFVAEVAEPPPPLIVPLAHTDFANPTFPKLLMHESFDDSPPDPLPPVATVAIKKNNSSKKMVQFRPPREISEEDLTLSKFSLVVPLGGASNVKDKDFELLTGWKPDFVAQFTEAVEKLIAAKFKPGYSLCDQSQDARAELEDEIVRMFPCVDMFVQRWPLDKILIRACKNSVAKERVAAEKALAAAEKALAAAAIKTLRPRKQKLQP
ncbi:hypothetical protein B0H15DRAFT_947923 [Mycena belliarum]|uniref:Uncharacterized protein n=1 Tax=Mycena belliarum TaxID=1033014 RepID=A0AAD6U705_9AGAR|nr:hypothetical protein B0H15DRAFT_947923 [Mycena belliae]